MTALSLPAPSLEARTLDSLHILTDDALALKTGVRVAFSGRSGGVSEHPYDGLNLGSHVGDDLSAVVENRRLLLHALDADGARLVMCNQVHGTDLVEIHQDGEGELGAACERALSPKGADGLVVGLPNVAALLCFADCAPVVIVSPTGRFAVAHAGWRGAVAGIAGKAARSLAAQDLACQSFEDEAEALASYNAYIGPHIHEECFETGEDVSARFSDAFGESCLADARHVSLARALEVDLTRAGLSAERILDSGVCTRCSYEDFFSYRASGGVCGRHGALAVRLPSPAL